MTWRESVTCCGLMRRRNLNGWVSCNALGLDLSRGCVCHVSLWHPCIAAMHRSAYDPPLPSSPQSPALFHPYPTCLLLVNSSSSLSLTPPRSQFDGLAELLKDSGPNTGRLELANVQVGIRFGLTGGPRQNKTDIYYLLLLFINQVPRILLQNKFRTCEEL